MKTSEKLFLATCGNSPSCGEMLQNLANFLPSFSKSFLKGLHQVRVLADGGGRAPGIAGRRARRVAGRDVKICQTSRIEPRAELIERWRLAIVLRCRRFGDVRHKPGGCGLLPDASDACARRAAVSGRVVRLTSALEKLLQFRRWRKP